MSVTKASVINVGESLAKKARQLEYSYTQQLDQEMRRIDRRYELYQRKAALEQDSDQRRSLRKNMNAQMTDELEAVDDRVLKKLIMELQEMCQSACRHLQEMASNVDMRQSMRQESVLPPSRAEWFERAQESVERPEEPITVDSAHPTSTHEMHSSQPESANHTNTNDTARVLLAQPTVTDSLEDESTETNAVVQPIARQGGAEQQSTRLEEPHPPTAQREQTSNGEPQPTQRNTSTATFSNAQPQLATVNGAAPSMVATPSVGPESAQESPQLRRTTRPTNIFNTRTSNKKRAAGSAPKSSSSKRQRSAAFDAPLSSRSVAFAEVYQNGQAAQKREILKHGDFFYYVECREHNEVYDGKTNSFKAASKHFRGEKHRLENQFESAGSFNIIIPRFGVHVRDCTDAKASANNRMLHRALAVTLDLHQDGGPRGQQKERGQPTTSELNSVLPQILKPWGLYAGFVSNFLRPLPIVVLPVLGTISSIGLEPEHQEAFLRCLPACVKYDKNTTVLLGWADEYQDGQAKVRQRLYPVLGFKGINYPKDVIMQWASIDELCALPFDRNETGEHVRQRKDAIWFASPQRRMAPAGTAWPRTASTFTTPELETGLPPITSSPDWTNSNEEHETSVVEPAAAPTQNTVGQDDDAASTTSDESLPTILEIMSSPATPKQNRDVLKPSVTDTKTSGTARSRSVTVDVNHGVLPLHSKPIRLENRGSTTLNSLRTNQGDANAAQWSWFREERPTLGRAAQPVMDFPARSISETEGPSPMILKRPADGLFQMKKTNKRIVKLRVDPRLLQQIHCNHV